MTSTHPTRPSAAGNAAAQEVTVAQAVSRRNKKVDQASQRNKDLDLFQAKARELGQHGPVTSDMVTAAMQAAGHDTLKADKENRRSWKGAMFPTSEWQRVGTTRSTLLTNNGRQATKWALLSWLQANPQHGHTLYCSNFSLSGIYRSCLRAYPGCMPDQFRWYIGSSDIAASKVKAIQDEHGRLYGIPVVWCSGHGAVLVKV